MAERSEATDKHAVRDAAPAYRVAPADTTPEDVPPGYKRAEVGVVPAQWEVRSLSSLSAFITKGSTPTTYGFKWEDGGRLFLRSECVSANGLDLSESMLISEAAHHFLRRSAVRDGDVLITITGNVGRVVFLNGVGEANINQHIARIRVTENNADNRYVFQYLSQTTVRKTFEKITTGQAYPQISLEQVRNALVPLPKLDEQRAIATALSDADALIESLDRLIAKKRAIKQAAMQQLLTGQARLPGFTGEWETKRLEEIVELHRRSITPSAYPDTLFQHFSLPAFDENKEPTLDRGAAIGSNKFQVPQQAVLVSKLNPRIPRIWMPKSIESNAVASTEFLLLTPREGISRDFLYVLCSSDRVAEQMELSATGTTGSHQRISPINVLKIEVMLPPSADEQTATATVLSDMDTEIEALERHRDKARQIKQGMMQQLLTGRIRLV